jgi:hypothetical protein
MESGRHAQALLLHPRIKNLEMEEHVVYRIEGELLNVPKALLALKVLLVHQLLHHLHGDDTL